MFQGMRYVYEVYREKSFSRAAENLFISQPSLSANVKRMEQRIGMPVFDRSTKPLQLTECGKAYIRAVEAILSIEHNFAEYVNDLENLKTGSVVIGGSSLFSSWVLPALIRSFTRQYPEVELTLVEENTASLSKLLLNGEVDLIIDNCELDERFFTGRTFRQEHLLLAVPAQFSVNASLKEYQISPSCIRSGAFLNQKRRAVPLERFREEPFILLKPDNDTRKRAEELCRAAGFSPRAAFELDQQMTSYNVACSGMGIAFITDTLALRVPENRDIIYYKLDGRYSSRKVSFYWKRGRYFSRAMEEFLRLNVPEAANKF